MDIAWLWGLLGGLLIGSATALHLLLNGRIAGLSGMMKSIATLQTDEGARLSGAYLLGAFGAALAVSLWWFEPAMTVTTSVPALVISGLLVGVGVAYSSGCTSGHGIAGMSRFSLRSILATVTFMAFTALTVWVLRHQLGVVL
jgi:uncharacterized membrane protein YedE/YeeE